MLEHKLPRNLIELETFPVDLRGASSRYAALSDEKVMPRGVNPNEIDHIDPKWKEGRDYQLVCGFEKDPRNLREVSRSENAWKNNKFLPWRWIRDELGEVPCEPGDLAFFLVGADIETDTPGEWVLMEFLSEGWSEAARKTCASSVARDGKTNPGVTDKAWDTIRSNPETYDRACRRLKQTAIDAWARPEVREKNRLAQVYRWGTMPEDTRTAIFDKISDSLQGHPVLVETGRAVAAKKFLCLQTGHISNAGALAKWQRVRGIDTSKRVELTPEEKAFIFLWDN